MENKDAQTRQAGLQIQAGKHRTLTKQIDLSHINPEYVGTFKFHHPTVIERMQIGVLKAQLLNGLEGRVDVLTDNIAHMTATLRYVLDSAPDWFNPEQIYEYEVLDAVYEEYIKFLDSFRRRDTATDNTGDSQESQ